MEALYVPIRMTGNTEQLAKQNPHTLERKTIRRACDREFPGGLVDFVLSLTRVCIQSLVRELRSHKSHSKKRGGCL